MQKSIQPKMSYEPQASSLRTLWLTAITEKSFNWPFTAHPRPAEGLLEASHRLLRSKA